MMVQYCFTFFLLFLLLFAKIITIKVYFFVFLLARLILAPEHEAAMNDYLCNTKQGVSC